MIHVTARECECMSVTMFLCREFVANVVILHHSTTIACGYQPVIHCGELSLSFLTPRQMMSVVFIPYLCVETGVLRQAAEMVEIQGRETLRTGESTTACDAILFLISPFMLALCSAMLFLQEPLCVSDSCTSQNTCFRVPPSYFEKGEQKVLISSNIHY